MAVPEAVVGAELEAEAEIELEAAGSEQIDFVPSVSGINTMISLGALVHSGDRILR